MDDKDSKKVIISIIEVQQLQKQSTSKLISTRNHILINYTQQIIIFYKSQSMQAPQPPVDIKVTMGSEQNCQNLVNINVQFTDQPDAVKGYIEEKKITENYGKDCVIMFDLQVQPGRQKQAIDYFGQTQQGEGKSPLQIVFSNRPKEHSSTSKFSIEQHQNFIRLIYRFIIDHEEDDIKFFNQSLQTFENNGLALQANVNFDIKGQISHNKKNRVNVKVDYAKFHFVSNAFNSEHLINSLSSIQQLHNDLQEVFNNPFTELAKKSKMAKINVKMDSFRKISKFYSQVSQQNKQPESKQFKYINKGIFRQKADAAMIYNNHYLIKATGRYESEDVFIRLLKVYSKFFQKILDSAFYDD